MLNTIQNLDKYNFLSRPSKSGIGRLDDQLISQQLMQAYNWLWALPSQYSLTIQLSNLLPCNIFVTAEQDKLHKVILGEELKSYADLLVASSQNCIQAISHVLHGRALCWTLYWLHAVWRGLLSRWLKDGEKSWKDVFLLLNHKQRGRLKSGVGFAPGASKFKIMAFRWEQHRVCLNLALHYWSCIRWAPSIERQ